MKRLIFGLAAIVMAAAGAAFTTPKATTASFVDSYFAFDYANYSPTEANVEDESKWIKVDDMDDCPVGTQRACKIRVSSTHVSGSSLLSTANINATFSSGSAFVVGGNLVDYENRANP